MQLTREDFQKFLYTYNEDELFYRTLYFEKKEHPETFHKFCLNLDCDLISRRQLYVPELQKEGWHSYFEEKAMFCDTADNIMLYKHYRYTPEFIHEHEFFEILCIYDGQAHTSIQGIEHTLHKGDVCIIPPNSFALARTVEYFRIPRNVLTVCLGKSTYARCGIIVNVTPFEPEWEGYVTLEFSNTTPLPAKIYAWEGCAQVLFFESDEVCETSYRDRNGKYQGQVGVTLPKA